MIDNIKLSAHVNLSEVTYSDTALRCGIENNPDSESITNLKLVCENVYEKVRNHFGYPIYISSGFRCKELNEKVGGQLNSQHTKGQALDLDCKVFKHGTNQDLFDYIKNNLEYDQVIMEGGANGWCHVSFRAGNNRKESFEIKNP